MIEIVDQPPPVPNDRPAIQDLVIADIEERKRVGLERYGVLLQAGNGRDALIDAYQEAMDLTIYLRQFIEERSAALLTVGPLMDSVGLRAHAASAAPRVHAEGAVGSDRPSLPARDSGEQFVDLRGATDTHEGPKAADKRGNGVDVAVLPRPRCLPVLTFGMSSVNVARARNAVNTANDILVRHRAEHADKWPWSAVLVVTGGQVEATLALKDPGEPSQIDIFHDPECIRGKSCDSLDLVQYLRQEIEERALVDAVVAAAKALHASDGRRLRMNYLTDETSALLDAVDALLAAEAGR